MLKLKKMVVAGVLAFPMLAIAQTNSQMQNEIDALKAQVDEMKSLIKQQETSRSTSPTPSVNVVDPTDFDRLQIKVDALMDEKETAGMKGLRISGGLDPTYIYNRAKGTSSFAFLNNFVGVNGSGETFSYDNSFFGMAYLDIQKEMDDNGTKFRLTLAPSKSTGSGLAYFSSIVHEASASIPITDKQTRFIVGQFPDVSGYQPFLNTFSGQNSIFSNQLFPGFGEFFVTKNLLFDFAAPFAYTGVGADITRGPWEWRLYLANFSSARNDVNTCPTVDPTSPTYIPGNIACASERSPTFIYNATYAKAEFWGFEFTGFEGKVNNWVAGGTSQLDQFEIDGWFTRAEFNGNLEFTVGRQKDAAFNGGNAAWWGFSGLASERITNRLTLAVRGDYINNEKNGGGTYALNYVLPSTIDNSAGNYLGDFYNGFGPGNPDLNANPSYDPSKGANRIALAFSATYRLTPYVALRGEVRHDISTTSSFYNFTDGTFQKTNDVFGMQTIVNF